MNIRDLIEALEEAAENHGDETEVRLAIQPGHPLVTRTDSGGILEADGQDPVFVIAQGEQIGYGSDELWALGF